MSPGTNQRCGRTSRDEDRRRVRPASPRKPLLPFIQENVGVFLPERLPAAGVGLVAAFELVPSRELLCVPSSWLTTHANLGWQFETITSPQATRMKPPEARLTSPTHVKDAASGETRGFSRDRPRRAVLAGM